MNEPKPFASLTSGLLARKGAARPAMRPQLVPHQHSLPADLPLPTPAEEGAADAAWHDLGWNDMGEAVGGEAVGGETVGGEAVGGEAPLAELATPPAVVPIHADAPVAASAAEPAVRRQQAMVARKVAAGERRSALAAGGKAAFTLRLDAERHLKLRLACTLGNRSAQAVVTEALDRLLGDLPELAALASQVQQGRRP